METIKRNSRGEAVKTLQRALNLYPDGIFGKLTEEAVREFQTSNGLTADGLVGPKTWAKLYAMPATASPSSGTNSFGLRKSKRNITKFILHCTATPEGRDYSVADIKKGHLARGFSDIGYHAVVYRDGSIHIGRDIDISGAHTTGQNTCSIGISYVGGVENRKNPKTGKYDIPKDTRTPEQKDAILKLLRSLRQQYPKATIHGHREFANKACPSFDAKAEYANI